MEDDIRVELYHGGEFQTKHGIYYYKGGTVDTLYNVDLSAITVNDCLEYLKEAGYGNDLKLYYKKAGSRSKDGYKLIWSDDCFSEIREDAKNALMIKMYVDHCAEEKRTNIVEEMDFVDDGIRSSDPDYTEEVFKALLNQTSFI